MAGKVEQTKGRLKEAVGKLSHNEKLKREGQLDETAGKAKEIAEKTQKSAEDLTKEK